MYGPELFPLELSNERLFCHVLGSEPVGERSSRTDRGSVVYVFLGKVEVWTVKGINVRRLKVFLR